jgi:hypothetical protein
LERAVGLTCSDEYVIPQLGNKGSTTTQS